MSRKKLDWKEIENIESAANRRFIAAYVRLCKEFKCHLTFERMHDPEILPLSSRKERAALRFY